MEINDKKPENDPLCAHQIFKTNGVHMINTKWLVSSGF